MKCCDLTASMLKHKVIIQKLELVADDAGGQTRTWKNMAEVWAYLKQTSGSERFQNDRLTAIAGFTATIRYRNDITEVNRLVYDNKSYQIRSADNLEFANKWIEFSLEAGVAT